MKVRCINSAVGLKDGETYEVYLRHEDQGQVVYELVGLPGKSFRANRFEVLPLHEARSKARVEIDALPEAKVNAEDALPDAPKYAFTVEQVKAAQAARHNAGKPQLSYLLTFSEALDAVAEVSMSGANVYGRGNYLQGAPLTEHVDSLLRHLKAFYRGEDLDPNSGHPHVAHMAWNALRLCQEALAPAPGTKDDRIGYRREK